MQSVASRRNSFRHVINLSKVLMKCFVIVLLSVNCCKFGQIPVIHLCHPYSPTLCLRQHLDYSDRTFEIFVFGAWFEIWMDLIRYVKFSFPFKKSEQQASLPWVTESFIKRIVVSSLVWNHCIQRWRFFTLADFIKLKVFRKSRFLPSLNL